MNDNPLKQIEKTEAGLKQKVKDGKEEAENKIALFKREQERTLEQQIHVLEPEIRKMKSKILDGSKGRMEAKQINNQKVIGILDRIDKKTIEKLSETIVAKVTKTK